MILPDGGRQYLGKIYSDQWMQENRYLEARPQLTAADLLRAKQSRPLAVAAPADKLLSAMRRMRDLSCSQLPATQPASLACRATIIKEIRPRELAPASARGWANRYT